MLCLKKTITQLPLDNLADELSPQEKQKLHAAMVLAVGALRKSRPHTPPHIQMKKPPLKRALNLIRHCESEGYVIPIRANDAIKYRGIGKAVLQALIELDVVLDPFHDLSTRPRNALYAYGLTTKEQVAEHIYFVGERKDARSFHNIEYKGAIRNLGFKGYLEICDWLGKP